MPFQSRNILEDDRENTVFAKQGTAEQALDDFVASGVLDRTKVYLAGNMECTADCDNWRRDWTRWLNRRLNVTVLDPTRNPFLNQVTETKKDRVLLKKWRKAGEYDRLHKYMEGIVRRDLRMIDVSDWVICKLEPSKPTFGTIHEFVMAAMQHKPLLVLVKDKKTMPLWLLGLMDHRLIFESDAELRRYLMCIHTGLTPLDDKFWKLLDYKYR